MHKIFGQREKGQYYDRSGAYLVIFSGEKTAVVRTARGLFLLGGGIQGSENDQECIRRECLEECGCECTVKEYLASAEAFSVHDTKGLFHPIQRYYMGRNFAFNNRILRFAGCTLGKTEDSIF